MGRFQLQVPTGMRDIHYIPDAPLVLNYEKYQLTVQLVNTQDILGNSRPQNQKSRYRLVDYPDLVFGVPLTERNQSIDASDILAQAATMDKKTRLKGLKRMEIMRAGGKSAYFAQIDFSGFTADVMLTHKDITNRFLRLLVSGSDPRVVLPIVSSFDVLKEKKDANQ